MNAGRPVPAAHLDPPGGPRAWRIWAGGLTLQVVGVFQRFSLGVAGVAAAHRLRLGAAGIGVIAVAQLAPVLGGDA